MTKHWKYLVTMDPKSRNILKVEQLGEAGDLKEVSVDVLSLSPSPPAASYTVNIFIGGTAAGTGTGDTVHFPGTVERHYAAEDIPVGGTHVKHRAPKRPERRGDKEE